VVVAPIDTESLRRERQRRSGHDLLAHLRPELYSYLSSSRLARAGRQEITVENLRERISAAKKTLKDGN
jgi:hypothetical protein